MSFTVREVQSNIIHFEFKSYRTMVRYFLRFQEFWENTTWKGKIFTHEQYKEWYLETNGCYDAEVVFAGCGMSRTAFTPFFNGKFRSNSREKEVLRVIRPIYNSCRKFFVMVTVKDDVPTYKHELAHAFYSVNKSYRDSVRSILNTALSSGTRNKLSAHLRAMFYDSWRDEDESHAYLMEGITHFIDLTGKKRSYTKKFRKEWKRASKLLIENYKRQVNEQQG